MNLEDLTPHLRTRIGRMERAVGWFVLLSALLLLLGFGYYFFHLAGQRGWFLIKAKFFTYVQTAAGLNVGDPVVLMGFQVGQITGIHAMPPFDPHNIRVEFEIKEPYFSYVLSEGSEAEVTTADLLGKRQIEITRGSGGFALYSTYKIKKLSLDQMNGLSDPDNWCLAQNLFDQNTNLAFRAYTSLARTNMPGIAALKPDTILVFHTTDKHQYIASTWDETLQRYDDYDGKTDGPRWLRADESPTVTEQAEMLVAQVRAALPNILALTNNISTTLKTMTVASSNFGVAWVKVQPFMTNLSGISARLREPGNAVPWAFGTNVNGEVQDSLTNLDMVLANLAGVSSNLNTQMAANSNFMNNLSTDVVDIDGFIHGMERVRLLRSAFKNQNAATNRPAMSPSHKQ